VDVYDSYCDVEMFECVSVLDYGLCMILLVWNDVVCWRTERFVFVNGVASFSCCIYFPYP
jgi:hypothetical protein